MTTQPHAADILGRVRRDPQVRCWCGRTATRQRPAGLVGAVPVVVLVCWRHRDTEPPA